MAVERRRIAEFDGGLFWVEIDVDITNPGTDTELWAVDRIFWANNSPHSAFAELRRTVNNSLIGTRVAPPGDAGSMAVTGAANNRRGVSLSVMYPFFG